jgi:hypothetical protein
MIQQEPVCLLVHLFLTPLAILILELVSITVPMDSLVMLMGRKDYVWLCVLVRLLPLPIYRMEFVSPNVRTRLIALLIILSEDVCTSVLSKFTPLLW